mmetsp:Transcript_46960/g.89663  ORF Transcript_46960/g.89663 Transcript_46960/m.89663 type:complete len:635 (-) Transcript_46960:227-2131(-)|eukprot:CAMPEP_0114253072 /NCGR_PEP_ID=MMETSP0058-20121206/16191_1 /TAXON_ID=36894 /ORGANISM="Pyramimonas parkeae, CCMP726" /LENGTH=634 /DNA_ID=CAMNT_0001367081 /DNA_START=313 /DNA_END=2217 /DNA_ORIENTATION=+
MGQAYSVHGYQAVPEPETQPLTSMALEHSNNRHGGKHTPLTSNWADFLVHNPVGYQRTHDIENGPTSPMQFVERGGGSNWDSRSIVSDNTETLERERQGYPPNWLEAGPHLPRAPFPLGSELYEKEKPPEGIRPLFTYELVWLVSLYVCWFLFGIGSLVWRAKENGYLHHAFRLCLWWVGFVYCWQFIELGFIIRFHIRNRRQNYSRYGYEEFLTSRHEEMSIGPPPPATALIVAYLPNEAGIIMQTLMHFKQYKYQGNLQVLLAYNTPSYCAVEEEIKALQDIWPSFTAIKVEGSTSKSDNVNSVMHMIKGQFVGVYDSDHVPMPGSFERAWRNLEQGFHYVQGRTQVNHKFADDWMGRGVAAEFEVRHGVDHVMRNCTYGIAMFGGSNGFWRTPALRFIGMDPRMLTEDIDASIRAMCYGFRGVYDHNLISREQPPPDMPALLRQRLRWTQGWYQVAWRSALRVPAAQRNLTRMQLVGMYWVVSMAMPVKVVYTHVLTFICLVMTFQLGVGYTFLLTSTWLLPQAIVCVFFCPELPVSWKVNFVINLIPGLILEIITHLVAQARFILGVSEWTVTTRKNDVSGRDAVLLKLKAQEITTNNPLYDVEQELVYVNQQSIQIEGYQAKHEADVQL